VLTGVSWCCLCRAWRWPVPSWMGSCYAASAAVTSCNEETKPTRSDSPSASTPSKPPNQPHPATSRQVVISREQGGDDLLARALGTVLSPRRRGAPCARPASGQQSPTRARPAPPVCLFLVAMSLSSLPVNIAGGKALTRPGPTRVGVRPTPPHGRDGSAILRSTPRSSLPQHPTRHASPAWKPSLVACPHVSACPRSVGPH
jgi:hypothetical protein